jgi:8-oxo-dGTP pyrophosphatase MutT (NUDIX family)
MSNIDSRLSEIDTCLYRVSVKAIIENDDKFLLVKEEDDPFWSFPGGGVDYGESTEEALVRELSEELGVPTNKVKIDGQVAFIAIGILDGIPKLNLFYKVEVSIADIKPTKHAVDHQWYSLEELTGLYISPSTGDVREQLQQILNGGKHA